MLNLLTLSHLDRRAAWAGAIERTLAAVRPRLEQMGRAVPMMAAALSLRVAGITQIVIAGGSVEERAALEREAGVRYLPFAILLRVSIRRSRTRSRERLPWIAAMRPIGPARCRYVCRDFACRQPSTDAAALRAVLAGR